MGGPCRAVAHRRQKIDEVRRRRRRKTVKGMHHQISLAIVAQQEFERHAIGRGARIGVADIGDAAEVGETHQHRSRRGLKVRRLADVCGGRCRRERGSQQHAVGMICARMRVRMKDTIQGIHYPHRAGTAIAAFCASPQAEGIDTAGKRRQRRHDGGPNGDSWVEFFQSKPQPYTTAPDYLVSKRGIGGDRRNGSPKFNGRMLTFRLELTVTAMT